ncbi:Acetyltransferase (GNAT) domain-containing protein [Amycolatopsis arida]|uniref:Acetyltransferase (GNAT) domain-containing protein n=1 Tax=Amycolatopsis arida TaxID=587909 RepID=A0A1I5QCE6_9PSEU|nr:GNAT family N-acetyltransferase [Amycolatopsis arida]TDX98789.1 acetyltransferase (GNAT) family protein [Amycolatopsis arida]SFP43903.1 Acetyltransferase (GNAT) domain-containing protein [Amycolatopsis arida]
MTLSVEIRPGGPGDLEIASRLVAEAFEPLAVSRWLVPAGRDERLRVLRANFRIHVEHALAHGHLDLIDGGAGVAVWFHLDGPEPPPPPADYDARLARACGPWVDRFRALDATFEAHHPHEVAHRHLAFLAIHPSVQGRGLGGSLLRQHHQVLDATGVGAYLEASSERSRSLYERHGYRAHGAPFTLPDGPPLWPLWRDPCPSDAG